MYTPPPADDNELTPKFNPATEDAANPDSPTDELFDIPMAITDIEPIFNEATEDAAAEGEPHADE